LRAFRGDRFDLDEELWVRELRYEDARRSRPMRAEVALARREHDLEEELRAADGERR